VVKPHDRLVRVSFTRHRASTSRLSTRWSTWGLQGLAPGTPYLGWASRLDAFSGYPFEHSYPAVPLARQLVHQRLVHPGPLVLGTASLKCPAPT